MATPKTRARKQVVDRVSADLMDSALALDQLGLIDQRSMARIKALCLVEPPVYSPTRVAAIRTRTARMSQSVFAKVLNVSVSTVQKWEAPAAKKHPSGAAAKLLQLIEQRGIDAVV